MTNFTTSQRHGYAVGDVIEINDTRRWWVKLWHRITGKQFQRRFTVTGVDTTTFT